MSLVFKGSLIPSRVAHPNSANRRRSNILCWTAAAATEDYLGGPARPSSVRTLHPVLEQARSRFANEYPDATDTTRQESEIRRQHNTPQAARPESAEEPAACPVFVMLPLDTVYWIEKNGRNTPELWRTEELQVALPMLHEAGVAGIMVDVWWGLTEREPQVYDWDAYRKLFYLCHAYKLKVQVVMSFHAAGPNVNDDCVVNLPEWVLAVGKTNPDVFYTDQYGYRNREYLSLGIDHQPLFGGRTPVEMYRDLVADFCTTFQPLLGTVITEITVGLGPAGELRFPAYPTGRWCFPGVGEFQCHDRYLKAKLAAAADAAGRPEWGLAAPHDAGGYNNSPGHTGFFQDDGGSWDTDYGTFFLSWYSGLLIKHLDDVLGAANGVINGACRPKVFECAAQMGDAGVMYSFAPAVGLGVKLAGVHWQFYSRSHGAELTCGYYNTRDRNGYASIMRILKKYNASVNFTCVEMRDSEHPGYAQSGPEGLFQQIMETAKEFDIELFGENALPRYDQAAFDKITEQQAHGLHRIRRLTFLRMGDAMWENFESFARFVQHIKLAASRT